MTAPQPTPLQRFVPVAQAADASLTKLLQEAADEAEGRITALAGRTGVGAVVRRAQLGQVRAELLKTAEGLYVGAGAVLVQQASAAGAAAADAAAAIDDVLFREFGGIPPELAAAHRAQAQGTVNQYLARTANGIPLSAQVYKTQALSSGLIDQQVNRSLLLGESWKEMADRVAGSIRPDVQGGVAYAAKRLGRTEINNAFHTAQVNVHKNEPWVDAMRWNLSGSHPTADECDEYAKDSHYQGGEPGVFHKGEVPQKPHPQCLCYVTSEVVSDDEFVAAFLDGKYDTYIDEKVYGYAPKSERPC